ncbi:hypothetical protein L1049_012718 [Liquidambar formosana]|uniref:Uncharacterized protein n=1 Tax=Liquidambar formosana TaxID=63359 RepID=A0AAP0RKY1_LIQFO
MGLLLSSDLVPFSREYGHLLFFFAGFLLIGNLFQEFWLPMMGCRFLHGLIFLRIQLPGSGFRFSFTMVLILYCWVSAPGVLAYPCIGYASMLGLSFLFFQSLHCF